MLGLERVGDHVRLEEIDEQLRVVTKARAEGQHCEQLGGSEGAALVVLSQGLFLLLLRGRRGGKRALVVFADRCGGFVTTPQEFFCELVLLLTHGLDEGPEQVVVREGEDEAKNEEAKGKRHEGDAYGSKDARDSVQIFWAIVG